MLSIAQMRHYTSWSPICCLLAFLHPDQLISTFSTACTREGWRGLLSLRITHCKICQPGQAAYISINALTLGQVLEAITDARAPFVGCTGRDEGPGLGHDPPFSHDFSFWPKKTQTDYSLWWMKRVHERNIFSKASIHVALSMEVWKL